MNFKSTRGVKEVRHKKVQSRKGERNRNRSVVVRNREGSGKAMVEALGVMMELFHILKVMVYSYATI